MAVGTVKWFDTKKGFGFILDELGRDVFVHYTVIQGEGFRRLVDGEAVEYELSEGPKGLLATNVRRTSDKGAASRASHVGSPIVPAPQPPE